MKRGTILRKPDKETTLSLRPIDLLIVAAVLHVAMTVTIFMVGRKALLPSTFDTNGTAVSFAEDGVGHRDDAETLTKLLRSGEFLVWFNSSYPFHVKLYSLCFVVFGSTLGINIVGAEPVNLFCYLGILIFVYKLGEETLDSHSGVVAAAVVGLWPSLLLHTTQLLKDPIFILGMLALIFVLMRLLTDSLSWRKALLIGASGGSLVTLLWKTRSDLGPVLVAAAILGAVALILRQFQLKRVLASSLAGMGLLLALTAVSVLWLPVYRDADNPRHYLRQETTAIDNGAPGVAGWWQVGKQVGVLRQRFVTKYPNSSSNIDSSVKLMNTMDLIRFLPRAAAIGLWAPFPKMWFERGDSVGSKGRMLSGLETLLMYVIEVLAVVGLWRGRRKLSVWLLFSIAMMGTIALGLVVVNVGTLYRLRYVFLIMLIILAAGGISDTVNWFMKRQSPRQKVSA
jgi:4-amino-4-deoxy-L-arabinose transferase-like glycosyltransferase